MNDDREKTLAWRKWMTAPRTALEMYLGQLVQSHHAAVKAKANLIALSQGYPDAETLETIDALNALILTPPVDPLLVEAREIAANTLDDMGASSEHFAGDIRGGRRDGAFIVHAVHTALKRYKRGEG